MSSGGLFGRISEQIDNNADSSAERPFAMADLLDLPDFEMKVARIVLRAGSPISIEDIATSSELERDDVAATVGTLSMRGILEQTDGLVRMGSVKRTSRIGPGGIFGSLGDL